MPVNLPLTGKEGRLIGKGRKGRREGEDGEGENGGGGERKL